MDQKLQNRMAAERTLSELKGGLVVLTNARVLFDARGAGSSKFVSIPLDAVASCGLVTRSQPILLLLAAAMAGVAMFQTGVDRVVPALVVAALLVLVFFASRRAVLTISPNGGEGITVAAQGLRRDEIVEFLNAVLVARSSFLRGLTRHSVASTQAAARESAAPPAIGRQAPIEPSFPSVL